MFDKIPLSFFIQAQERLSPICQLVGTRIGPFGNVMLEVDSISSEACLASLSEVTTMTTASLPNGAPNTGKWMSPKEQQLYDACNGEFRTAQDICDRAGVPCDTTRRGLLTNLVDRELLESNSQKGYRRFVSGA